MSGKFEAVMRELLSTPEGRAKLKKQAELGLDASLRLRKIFDTRNQARGWIALLRAVRLVERQGHL